METKICAHCKRELPLTHFKVTRWGGHAAVCNECIAEKRAQTRYDRINSEGGVKQLPFLTPTSMTKPSAMFGARCVVRRSGSKAAGARFCSTANIEK